MSDSVTGPTPGDLAGIYDAMAVDAEGDEATTFTNDHLFEAATRLVNALAAKLAAAEHIRGSRPL